MIERLTLLDVQALARDCLARAGAPDRVAQAVAAEIAAAEAAGERRHGMEALLRDIRLIRYGRVDAAAAPSVSKPRPAVMRCDAAHGFAAAALVETLETLADLAHRQGIALLRLDRASDPGAMIHTTAVLAAQGLSALTFGAAGPGRIAHPDCVTPAILRHPPRDAVEMLLPQTRGGQPPDSPIGGMVTHGAWVIAMDAASVDDTVGIASIWDSAPPRAPTHEIAISSEFLEQIVTA